MTTGLKFDDDKPRWDLLPIGPLREVVNVLTFGARKYADDNWKHVDNARRRYLRAAIGHIAAWMDGERADAESRLHPLAHAACSLLFMIWFDLEGENSEDAPVKRPMCWVCAIRPVTVMTCGQQPMLVCDDCHLAHGPGNGDQRVVVVVGETCRS